MELCGGAWFWLKSGSYFLCDPKYLPTAFFRSAKKRRTPEFRVRYVVLAPVGRFKFDDRAVKLKQEVLRLR
jgi:hypothetical protein